jgi:uncharacterized protein DUF6286
VTTLADVTSPAVPATGGAAKPPVGAPAATGVALASATALVALGVIAARDVLISAGAITGTPWIVNALDYVDGLTAQTWMTPAGVGVAVVGLLLMIAAVKPRRRTHRPLSAPDTWIAPRDVNRLARNAVEPLTGVASASVTGSVNKISLTLVPLAGYQRAALESAARTAVTEALAPMARPPRVRVRINERELP